MTKTSMAGLKLAQRVLKGEPWVPTPLLPAPTIGRRLGTELWLKREDCTPAGSFKLRGALVAMAQRAEGLSDAGVYVASAGNYGLAIALAGQRHNVRVTVVVPYGATPSKVERIRLCGASIIQHGQDFDAAKAFARVAATQAGAAFWEDGVIEEMAHGAATIGAELFVHPGPWDYILVPIGNGNGSLVKGIASVVKGRNLQTKVIGVVPAGAPSMAYAIKGQAWNEAGNVNTIADGLAVRVPIKEMIHALKSLVDEIWLVEESTLLPAVKSLMELEQVLAEPSAAIAVAGLAEHRQELAARRGIAILTGSHLRLSLVPDVMGTKGLV